ncbi:mandelate racemase/muconate lactonizing enzyme family protein [Neolewinella sp.]|uniref:mandelate racemase/muconate lactonizing enzyme family protein n=1 Tax=Neolewinella sp. TaxID=2993543 RepID=UPI003B515E99
MTGTRRKFLTVLGSAAATTCTYATGNAPPIAIGAPPAFQPLVDPADVRITDVRTFLIKRGIMVRVQTNVGITGWGESSSNSPTEVVSNFIERGMRQVVMDQSPFDNDRLWNRMYWENHDLGPAGALTYAIAGVDLALWDIKGKVLGVPCYQLLGGSYRDRVPAYGGIPLGGGTVPLEEAVDRAQKLVDLGFRIVKLRMQIREYNLNPTPDPTLRYYEAIRRALPDGVELFVDPNEGYTAGRAIQIGRALQEMGMNYFESPCPLEAHADTRQVVEALDIPVLAGEKCYNRWQVRDLIVQANPAVIQPDVIKGGGITEYRKMCDLGSTFFKTVAPHNTKPSLGTAAALHCVCSIPNFGPFLEFVELDTYDEVLSVFDNGIRFEEGLMYRPEGPGLGLTMIEDKLERLAGG